ncbi:MAG: PAN domain-containing protein, partial [Myxococcales bacterium]|nr:PAN domain-containing protein [Myxococcales bacterium]
VGTSPSVQVRVKRARRPFPWWIVVVAAVVLVGAGVGLWLATRSPDPLGLGAACGADIKASCGAPLTCDRGQCRFPVGKGPCAAPGDCVSDACVDQLCAVPRPVLGQTCSPSTGCATDDLTCVAGRCRLITGRSGCTKAEDCVSQGCEGGVCVLPGEGQPCLQGQCGAGLKCFTFQQSAFCVAGEINVDRAGSDYSVTQLSTPNPAECRALCKRDQTCKAWTFVKPGVQGPQARCYLKRPAPGPTNNTCCVSGLEHR